MMIGAAAKRSRIAVAAFTAAAVIADAFISALPTAAFAIAAILVATSALSVAVVQAYRRRRASLLLIALFLVVLMFAGLRGYVFVLQLLSFRPASSGAALTYNVLWLATTAAAAAVLWAEQHVTNLWLQISARPRRILSGSFALLILTTAALLTLPISVNDVGSVSIVDALFTAASAVSVTGLTVNDVATTYSWFGQGVILLAIQLGGIGIMTLAALAVTMIRDTIARESTYVRVLDADNLAELRSMVRGVVVGTLSFEAAGAALLWLLWSRPNSGVEGDSVLWLAVFHAVSAFCNAGFSLFSDSLARFSHDGATLTVIAALVVIGGLGFPVWRGLAGHGVRRAWHVMKKGAPRPVHVVLATRVPIVVSALLLAAGAVGFLLFEWNGSLGVLGFPHRFLNALFCSVITRSAGFTTVGFAEMHDATLLFAMALMFIGGSPGSTAGGIKTTTAAVIFAALRGELRGHEPRLFGRALDKNTVRRAIAVMTISLGAIFCALLLMMITEDRPMRELAFEVVSAFTTTGASTGITPTLSSASKLILVVVMFAGRVGPLTLAIAVGMERKRALHRLPSETLPVG